jgi:hypothetical protein
MDSIQKTTTTEDAATVPSNPATDTVDKAVYDAIVCASHNQRYRGRNRASRQQSKISVTGQVATSSQSRNRNKEIAGILGSGGGSINHNKEIAGKEQQIEPKERSHRIRKKENTIKSKPHRDKQANKRTVMEEEDSS